MAVGMGLVFCGITTGGKGGGGIWAGFPWPLLVPVSYGCWPGAPANVWGGGGSDMADEEVKGSVSAIEKSGSVVVKGTWRKLQTQAECQGDSTKARAIDANVQLTRQLDDH
jgi:hypothetical protein